MNTFFIFFIIVIAIELFLMIEIGSTIGALNTVALIFITAIIGIYYAKFQGIRTLKSGIINLYQNKIPIYELLSGASIALAAVLLIVPGFLTDLIGLFFLIPITRNVLLRIIFKNKNVNNKKNENILDGEIVDNNKDDL